MALNHYTRLEQSSAAFNKMIQKFGVVTVMNAKVWETSYVTDVLLQGKFEDFFADQICQKLAADDHYLCELTTLKTSNITQEGPTKTITGGQNASPLLKYGKTARLEMQDALGNAEALEALGGMTVEYLNPNLKDNRVSVHASDVFAGSRTILGESFFIDQDSGAQVDVYILIYQFVPDSLFNLTQDAEGDATVFDLNGDLVATKVQLGTKDGGTQKRNLFYSIVDKNADGESTSYFAINPDTGVITLTQGYKGTADGDPIESGVTTIDEGTAAYLIISTDVEAPEVPEVVFQGVVSREPEE